MMRVQNAHSLEIEELAKGEAGLAMLVEVEIGAFFLLLFKLKWKIA